MSDPPVMGSDTRPVSLDPFQNIIEVHWGGVIGLLTIDLPDTVRVNVGSPEILTKFSGDTITKANLASSVTRIYTDHNPVVLRRLSGSKKWEIRIAVKLRGPDPGPLMGPNPFGHAGDPFIVLNEFAHNAWTNYDAFNYTSIKAQYDGIMGRRWIEIGDLKSLNSEDTFMTHGLLNDVGVGQRYRWDTYPYYGEETDYYYQYQDAHTTTLFGGFEQYNIVLITGDQKPGNLAFINFGANTGFAFAPSEKVLWGLGEIQSDHGVNLDRETYLIDFSKIDIHSPISIVNENSTKNDDIGEFSMVFVLKTYPNSTKFTVSDDTLTADKPSSSSVTKTASYYQGGQLFQIDRKGFV